MGDYYPLAVQSRDLEAWEAWQFHDAAAGEGFVQAFRLNSRDSSRNFALNALDPRKTYLLTEPYTGRTRRVSGSRLLIQGIHFELSPLQSQLWIYSPLTRPVAVR